MKIKILLKFYFNAESLNERLNGLITYRACRAEGRDCFERVLELIEDKQRLCSLMNYLETVFKKLTEEDKSTLKEYADLRIGIVNLKDAQRREIKRAVMKFSRKLTNIDGHTEEVRVLKRYRAVL